MTSNPALPPDNLNEKVQRSLTQHGLLRFTIDAAAEVVCVIDMMHTARQTKLDEYEAEAEWSLGSAGHPAAALASTVVTNRMPLFAAT